MVFKDLESLKEYLIEDQKKATINPVRFINVETMEMWVETKKIVLSLCDRSLFLSDFCESDDTTPNIRRITSKLKSFDKTTLVAPLSEYLRIKPEVAQSTILKLLSTEYSNNDNGKTRIYFLMYRMKDILRTIPNDDPRRNDAISYLITSEESDYSLTIIQDDLDVSLAGNEIYGFKSYLEYWEQNPDKPLILHTKNAIYFEDNNFFDNVKVISNSYDLLRLRYNIPSSFSVKLGDNSLWNDLAKVVTEQGDFESACKHVFNSNRYTIDIFEFWNRYSDFQRWLLLLWMKIQTSKSYIISCANKAKNVNEFIELVFVEIFDYLSTSAYSEVYSERKQLLKKMNISSIPKLFWDSINALSLMDALKCLTDLTDVEKKTVFTILQRVENYDLSREYINVLETVYPDLAKYLGADSLFANINGEISQYFAEYKWLKIINKLTESFNEKVKSYARTKGELVYQLQTRREIINNLYDDETAILFVDGLGAEYIDYIAYLFSDLSENDYAISYNAGYCHLPTITEINKDFLNGKNVLESIYALDELKHSTFSYPLNITKEFEEIKKIKDLVLNSFNGNIKKVIIASDHGTSRLAVLVRETPYDNKIKKDGLTLFRYGRYCNGTEYEQELDTTISYDDKLIFADYSRFEQKGAPSDEIHGGASMEEWIIPVVCVEKVTAKKKEEKVTINLLTPIVTPELGTGKVVVEFSVKGRMCKNLFAMVKGQRITCEGSGVYKFDYIPVKNESEIKVKVLDSIILGEFTVQIKQKITQNKNFDI